MGLIVIKGLLDFVYSLLVGQVTIHETVKEEAKLIMRKTDKTQDTKQTLLFLNVFKSARSSCQIYQI